MRAASHDAKSGTWLQLCSCFTLKFKVPASSPHLSRCVTFASATASACRALNGYWKSNVYALPSILPNCMTCAQVKSTLCDSRSFTVAVVCRPVPTTVRRVQAHTDKYSYLTGLVLDLEVLGGLLRHASPEVQLVDLRQLVPKWRFVLQNKFAETFLLHFRPFFRLNATSASGFCFLALNLLFDL